MPNMSSFSRGLFFRHQCLPQPAQFLLKPSGLQPRPRFFTTSNILDAAKKSKAKGTPSNNASAKSTSVPVPTARKPTSPSTTQPVPNSKPPPQSYRPKSPTSLPAKDYTSYTTSLARKSNPTLFYEAGSFAGFTVACFSGAAFFIGEGLWHWHTNVMNLPSDIACFVSYMYGAVCIMFVGAGYYMLRQPTRLIKTIQTIPLPALLRTHPHLAIPSPAYSLKNYSTRLTPSARSLVQNAPAPIKTAILSTSSKSTPPPLLLQITLHRPLAFLTPQTVICLPSEASIPHPLSLHLKPLPDSPYSTASSSPTSPSASLPAPKPKKSGSIIINGTKEYIKYHILGLKTLFKYPLLAFREFFWGARRSFTREGFLELEIRGWNPYRLDVLRAWGADDGRGLDRVIRVRSSGL